MKSFEHYFKSILLENKDTSNINYWATQRSNTEKSYIEQKNFFQEHFDKNSTIIDYGSGLGIAESIFSGFNYVDFEPYPQDRPSPDFNNSTSLVKAFKNDADGVVCNLVLNVVDKLSERKNIIKNILNLLKKGGVAFIVTRTPSQIELATTKIPYKDGYLMSSGKKRTFQKGFTFGELSSYVKSVIPEVEGEFEIGRGVGAGGNTRLMIKKI